MSESLSDPTVILAKLHLDQILVLVSIVRSATLLEIEFVHSIYKEQARYFRETLEFLKVLGWVQEDGTRLTLDAAVSSFEPNELKGFDGNKAIVEAIAERSGPYQAIFADYLAQFRCNAGTIFHQPSSHGRLEESGIRNFLMEIGMVSHQPENDTYVLHEKSAHLYLWARNIRGARSKAELLRCEERKDQLGTSAEIAVLQFEIDAVGVDWRGQVKHVSAENPGACFDIKSLRVHDGKPVPRFIEVKAVPADSLQFFWTAREVEAAALLRDAYFLYLVPVNGGRCDLSVMQIIGDPYSSVYENADQWMKEENIIVCRRRSIAPSS
jgi:hypothetical protein